MGHGDNAQKFEQHRKMGLVTNIFTKDVLMKLKGNLGIGNTVMFFVIVFPQLILYLVESAVYDSVVNIALFI